MVTHIDSTAEQFSTLRVCPGDEKVLRAHHIPLETSRNKPVDMFAYGYNDLACEVTALLSAMELVFEVDRSSTILSEELGKL